MAVTRSMTRKKNQDEQSRKRAKALEEIEKSPWLNLMDEIFFLILMRLGVADFASFSIVCKRWRAIALSVKKMFLSTRQPLSLSFSTKAYKKYCHLEDFDKRRFKTNLPHSAGRTCVGVTCGYLIFYGTKAYDFWLVNPITRHELQFPRYYFDPTIVRGNLVLSPLMSGWMIVHIEISTRRVSFCLAGEESRWGYCYTNFIIHDMYSFKGKIYVLTTGSQFCEVSLDPILSVTLLGTDLLRPVFTSSGENLFVIGYNSENVYMAREVDLAQKKLGCPFKPTEKYACFVNTSRLGGVGKVGLWTDPEEQFERYGHFHGNEVNLKGRVFNSNMWYFPHDCLNVNRLQE